MVTNLIIIDYKHNKKPCISARLFVAHLSGPSLGLNQRPPDYESGATNQLSYRTKPINQIVI